MQQYQLSNIFNYLYHMQIKTCSNFRLPACHSPTQIARLRYSEAQNGLNKLLLYFDFSDQRYTIQNTRATQVSPSMEQTSSVYLPSHLTVIIFNAKCNILLQACWISLQSETIDTSSSTPQRDSKAIQGVAMYTKIYRTTSRGSRKTLHSIWFM